MASLLRQIVAGPRARHPEAGLDLCYVTDHIIATSGPSQTYPQLAYRNPLDQLVTFLDSKHGQDWAIWEFRAEGTGYPDDAVYNRVRHYPWPDHHPPPFRLVPLIMASMRNWLHGGELADGGTTHDGTENSTSDATSREEKRKKRVVVVHCKAGKGRSGTASCSYLIAEEGWKPEDALARFTERRMRPKFGAGISIPSQLRWISYVERWTRGGKKYVERPIEVVEIHVWGLRSGVKVDVEGFADEGKRIEILHTFKKNERVVVDGTKPEESSMADLVWEMAGYNVDRPKGKAPEEADFADATNPKDLESKTTGDEKVSIDKDSTKQKALSHAKSIKRKGTQLLHKASPSDSKQSNDKSQGKAATASSSTSSKTDVTETSGDSEPGGMAVILRPTEPIRIANSDVNISVERRNKTHKSMGLTMVTAVAHVWFNTFFEGQGPERDGRPENSGVFGIEWDAMDGIKGSSRKGARAFDRIAVVWRVPGTEGGLEKEAQGEVVEEPAEGQPVPQTTPADWKGTGKQDPDADKQLGLRVQSSESVDVSKASSLKSVNDEDTAKDQDEEDGESLEGVKSSGPSGDDLRVDDETIKTLDKKDGDGKTQAKEDVTQPRDGTQESETGQK
ncbi:Telomerase protein component 1 [Neonectria magnoliae]|uniref:phosphatidylinositol-3,4,5-trisphosphate 3-phosphatase n=1 Tax=Neonectria magnoliae TaxID=2732573 RepID=A0ABR1H3T1_9HYPO